MHLREYLELAVKELDPEGKDAALRQMTSSDIARAGSSPR